MRRISAACRAEHCEASENDRLWESTPPHHQIIVHTTQITVHTIQIIVPTTRITVHITEITVHTTQIIVCTTFGLF